MKQSKKWILLVLVSVVYHCGYAGETGLVAFMTDFGVKDGAVAAMKGVALGVDRDLQLVDITHEIPPQDVRSGAYRLDAVAKYLPRGTVFVVVVDPGVGTNRKSIVLKTKSGHYFVGPDNGSFTLVAEHLGIDEVREIDEEVNRLKGSEGSATFHGRDVYAYTGARLAGRKIGFDEVGPGLNKGIVALDRQKVEVGQGVIIGHIPVLDVQYGNVWTNIDQATFEKAGGSLGAEIEVEIYNGNKLVWSGDLRYCRTFGEVEKGQYLIYINSVGNIALGMNQGDFAKANEIGSGDNWVIRLKFRIV